MAAGSSNGQREVPAPVDAYLMFDQSSSMGDMLPGSNPSTSWWQAAQIGVTNFVNDPRAAGSLSGHPAMSVGIQFFPLGGIAPQSCMADYTTPEAVRNLHSERHDGGSTDSETQRAG